MSDPMPLDRPLPQLPPVMPWGVLPGLAALVLLIFAGGFVAAFMWGNETQQTTMLTASVTLSGMAVGYFFQSSFGSQKKDETMARISIDAAATKNGRPPI
jgi:hypothetical protein